jgi:RimJ/RimL family protein N-acetyltransferase
VTPGTEHVALTWELPSSRGESSAHRHDRPGQRQFRRSVSDQNRVERFNIPSMTALLRTERLVLRRVATTDVDNFVTLNADLDVMRFIDRRPPTRDRVVAEIDELVKAYDLHPEHGRFVAEDMEETFLGWFGLLVTSRGSRVPELGYRLRRRVWGQGLATEGSRALIDHAFAHLGVARISADTMAVNTASRRVMEKSGMRHIRTFHGAFDDPLPGSEFGEVVYEILREDWQRDK